MSPSPSPAKQSKPAQVRVVVREGVDDPKGQIIHDRTGDHNYADFRDWITHTTYWAVRNGKTVTISPG